jgi:transposase InsO family protein
VKYAWIKQHPVMVMCHVLQLSSSGYYGWLEHQPSAKQQRRQHILRAIGHSYFESRRIYGYRKVHQDLLEANIVCCEETVRRIMRDIGLYSRVRRKFVLTTDSNHSLAVAENLLDRDFTATTPNQKWVADITYIPTSQGWLYLAAVMDLYSRRIVGWAMNKHIDSALVISAMNMALSQRRPETDLLHHSDRGSQYASDAFQDLLDNNGVVCSMSRKGDCWDNACMESFFGSLKTEWLGDKKYKTRQEAKNDIFKYIELFYNRKRRHAALGYLSPAAYEELYEKERKQVA